MIYRQRPAQFARVRLVAHTFGHLVEDRSKVFNVRLNRKELPDQREDGVERRVEGSERRLKRQKLSRRNHVCRAFRRRLFEHAGGGKINRHRQQQRLNRRDDGDVIGLPTDFQMLKGLLAERFRPKMISLLLRALTSEFRQPRKNLLDDARNEIRRRDHRALSVNHASVDDEHDERIQQPDAESDRRQLQAVVAHQNQAPKRKDEIADGADNGSIENGLCRAEPDHAVGEIADGVSTEKFCRQRHQSVPNCRFDRHAQVCGDAHDGDGSNHGQDRDGKTRHQHDLSDCRQPAPIQNRNDVGENGFGDDGRDDRQQSDEHAHADHGRIIELPTLPRHEFEQIDQSESAGSQAGITRKCVLRYVGGNRFVDGTTAGEIFVDDAIMPRAIGNERGKFFVGAVISDHHAAVGLMPIGFEGDEAHLHVALLDQPTEQPDPIEFVNEVGRK